MSYSPTIIAASLDDAELRKSIDKLVNHVDDQLHYMVASTKVNVKSINDALKTIGDIDTKLGSKGSKDGGAAKQIKAQEELAESVKKTTSEIKKQGKEQELSFDQMRSSIEKAIRVPSEMRMPDMAKSARDSFIAFQHGYKEQAQQIFQSITKAENALNDVVARRIERLKQQLEETKRKLNELYSVRTIQESYEGSGLRTNTRKLDTQIERQLLRIKELEEQIAAASNGMVSPEMSARLGALRADYARISNMMKEDVTTTNKVAQSQQQVAETTQQTAQAAKVYTNELQKQLQSIQNRKDATGAFEKISLMPSGTEEEIRAKGRILQEFIEKVRNTPLISQTNFKLAEKMLKSLANQIRAIREEKERTARTAPSAASDVVTKRSLENEKKALEELRAREAQRREEIIRTGVAAQEQAYKIRESINQQMQTADYTKQLEGVKDLQTAVSQMRNALKQPLDSGVKQELERALAVSKQALDVAKRYNMTVAGLGAIGVGGKASTDTLAAYSAEAQRLAGIYKNLSTEERSFSAGHGLKRKYQELSRTASQVRKELERPINLKEAMKGDEKTLDDIAYKMQRLQNYKRGIDITDPKQSAEISTVDKEINRLQKDLDKYMSTTRHVREENTALGRSWSYMKNRLAFYFTVGASTQFIKNLIEVRSQYEINERALGILIDSAERGTQIFNELSQMALVSPYTLIELSTAAKQLTAYDVAAKDVVDTTRRLADMAAAVGIPIERLTYALGQIKAYGYLNSRDARMFANAGIPLVKQLSDYYTELEGKLVSTADVYDRIKKKAIDYNEVMEVINKMTDQGGKFFDFQAKMADTLKVRLANLTLAWNNMLNDMGKEEQGVLTWGIGALREMFLHWKQLDSLIKNAAWALGIRTALMFIAWGALKAGNAFGIMSKQMALSAVFGTKLANVLKNVGYSVIALAKNKWTWISLFAVAAVEASKALLGVNEAQKALNESIRNGAKDNYNNIRKFSEQYQEVRETLYKSNGAGGRTPVDIDNNEAKKVWDAIREQIELTVTSSDEYIGKLLTIENMSERVRQGFNLLDDVQVVNAALKEIDDNTIKVTQDWDSLLGTALLPEGLISDLKDFAKEENSIIEKFGSLSAAREKANQENEHARVNLQDYDAALKEFRSELEKTTQSVLNFIQVKGWSGDEGKINQVFEQITQKLVLDNQLDPQEAFTLQTEVEEARSEAAKQALLQRINDEKAAYKISHDEQLRQSINADIARYNSWSETNGRSKVEWERFTKWLKEQHISETTAMFRNMDAEDIKSLNFQEGKHAEWVTRMVTQYAKEHKMSYDEAFKYLKNWVRSANQWSIFIPLTISTEDKKSVYDQLGEYDKAIDDADAQIERLTKRINELNAKKKKSKEETQELANAEQELADAQKAKADAEAKGGHGKKEKKDEKAAEKAARKAAKQSETELQKALKDELSVIEKVRSIYKELTKEGMSHADAVELATEGWDETVNAINRILQKNGLQRLDLAKFVGVANPRELVNMLQSQLDVLVRRGAKPAEIKEFQATIRTLNVDASKYDLTMITNGLNNELSKLKDEYELAVAIDADPEMGNLFAEMFGINTETLPHTVKEYADKYTEYLNKYLKENKSSLQFGEGELFSLTFDDMEAFQKQVGEGTFQQAWFDEIKKAYDDINGKRKKDIEDTEKWKNSLIEKYGNLQDKLTKIYKDSVQNQVNAVKTFGTEGQKSEIVRLRLRLEATDDPAELAEINTEIAKIVKDVTDKNPIALKLVTASGNQTRADASKAYWEDFKNSELYAMTFEDMANNSTRAIQLIMDKLEMLKDKVKEDPASMKALIKSLEDAQKELNTRDPFGGIARSLRDMADASQEAKTAQEALWRAEVDVEQAQQEVDNAEDGTPEEQAAAQQKLADAVQRRAAAQVNLTKAENKGKKAQENLKSSLQGITGELNNVKSLFDTVSSLFRAGGDDETADAINAISEGFTVMTTVIMGVVAAMIVLQSTTPWLLAIAAALSVIVGLVSFLSGNSNKKITEQVEESERAVKRLENSYKDLEFAVEHAYGMAEYGAKRAVIANKQLQLVELQRQLMLEQSRDSKKRDEDRILELKGSIIDLRNEIKQSIDDITNDLMGITSVGDAAEQLVSSMIDAFRRGEDYMTHFDESFEDMIDNMIMKAIVSRVIGDRLDEVWEQVKQTAEVRGEAEKKRVDALTKQLSDAQDKQLTAQAKYDNTVQEGLGQSMLEQFQGINTQKDLADANAEVKRVQALLKQAEKDYAEAIQLSPEDIQGIRDSATSMRDDVKAQLEAFMEAYSIKAGDRAEDKNLSNLQQGISQVSESTANAVEAYLNGMSQQAYLRNNLLTQIRDTVQSFDLDVQTATQAQMLLQLQQSYAVQMAIQGILESVLTPNGRSFYVELAS